MRVAIVGGNLLGTATAFYTSKALESLPNDYDSHHEIHIFEKQSSLAGSKFATLSLPSTATAPSIAVAVGTARHTDITSAPALSSLLSDADIHYPTPPVFDAAIFHWSHDYYIFSHYPFYTLSYLSIYLSTTPRLSLLLRLLAFFSTLLLLILFFHPNFPSPHPLITLFPTFLAFGLIKPATLLRFYNAKCTTLLPRLLSNITYGPPTVSALSAIHTAIKTHLRTILRHDSATTCITLGHLLSACGLAKYATQSSSHYFTTQQIPSPFLNHLIYPFLSHLYPSHTFNKGQNVSALASLLASISTSPVPTSVRSHPLFLHPNLSPALCPALARAAHAQVHTDVDVTSVTRATENTWNLSGISNCEHVELGVFDAVILAAVVHTGTFSTDAFPKADLCKELAFEKVEHSRPDGRRELDVSKYVALVRGDIKPQYVAKSHQCYMPTTIMVVDSINCSEICRVGERAWRIATGEMPTLNCSVLDSLFSHVEDVVFLKAGPRAYDCAPLHSVNGAQAPGLVLGTRFLNAACIDRVGNDVNLDCLAARNAASFFRHGAATWK